MADNVLHRHSKWMDVFFSFLCFLSLDVEFCIIILTMFVSVSLITYSYFGLISEPLVVNLFLVPLNVLGSSEIYLLVVGELSMAWTLPISVR